LCLDASVHDAFFEVIDGVTHVANLVRDSGGHESWPFLVERLLPVGWQVLVTPQPREAVDGPVHVEPLTLVISFVLLYLTFTRFDEAALIVATLLFATKESLHASLGYFGPHLVRRSHVKVQFVVDGYGLNPVAHSLVAALALLPHAQQSGVAGIDEIDDAHAGLVGIFSVQPTGILL
jgi:hypothetical protein